MTSSTPRKITWQARGPRPAPIASWLLTPTARASGDSEATAGRSPRHIWELQRQEVRAKHPDSSPRQALPERVTAKTVAVLISLLEESRRRRMLKKERAEKVQKTLAAKAELTHLPEAVSYRHKLPEKPLPRKRTLIQPLRIVRRNNASGPLIHVRNAELSDKGEMSYAPVPKEYIPVRNSVPGDWFPSSESTVKLVYRL